MQYVLQKYKCIYCSIYRYFVNLILLTIFCFLAGCSGQKETQQVLSIDNQIQVSKDAININTASVAELERLPHVGAKTARDIIEYREKYGKFRKPEHLMLVRRISDERFREIQTLIKVK